MGAARRGGSPPVIEELYASIGRSMALFYGTVPGARCEVRDGAVLGCSGLGASFLNAGIVYGEPGLSRDEAERRAAATLGDLVGVIRGLGSGGYVCLGERLRGALEPLAREMGLVPLELVPLMWRAPGAPPPEPAGAYSCERVRGDGGLAELLAVSAAAYEFPAELYGRVVTPALLGRSDVSFYLCRRDGRAVSCVYAVDDDGVVGVAGMATLPERQGEGAGGVLLRHVLRAHAPGARAFCLTASAAGLRLYERSGFVVVDEASAWLVPAPD